MELQVISIKDRAIDAYMRPWFAQTTGQAIRMFQDEINNPQGDMHKHPDDYDLYRVATFDDQTGKFTNANPAPQQLAIGKQLKDNT